MRYAVTALAMAALLLPLRLLADPGEHTSTVTGRLSLHLTVYNGGLALVHDLRRIALNRGFNRISWRDVSAQMDPTSASLAGGNVGVLEQNFNYDVMTPQTILQKYVGQEVTVVHPGNGGRASVRERARILAAGDDGIVLQYADRIETSLRGGYIEYPALPKNLRDRPTLDIDLETPASGTQTLDLSYLTGGLSWYADYVGVLSADERRMNLTGLVTMSNTSGVDYDDALLQLVAGNVNLVAADNYAAGGVLKTIATVRSSAPSEENYFEYHLYTMPRPTTILNRQTKQLTLLTARDIPVVKTLELRGNPSYYQNDQPDIGERLPVGVYVSFANRGGDLGVPLPAGTVRIYKSDSRGLSEFAGSDGIDHTPRNETVRLHLGDSFDVTARKRQTDFHFTGTSCSTKSSYDITLSNAKSATQSVLVVEPIPGDWKIPSENLRHAKSSSSSASWNVSVPANGRADLFYTADVTWC
jgi:hypothetical protein